MTRDDIVELRDEVRATPTPDLLDNFIIFVQHVELGQRPVLSAWEFRAQWQELRRRGMLSVQ